jgi:hypothetical protein
MLLVPDLPEREAVAPQMAAPVVLRVEVLRVDAVDAVERAGEPVAPAFNDEVVVVRHQAEGERAQLEPFHRPPQLRQEREPVFAVEVHVSLLDAARRHVPDTVGREARAGESRHRPTVASGVGPKHPVKDKLHNRCTSDLSAPSTSGDCPQACPAGTWREWAWWFAPRRG